MDVSASRKSTSINKKLAERVGFEPTLEFPLNTLSKRAPSATRPSLPRKVGTYHKIEPKQRVKDVMQSLYSHVRERPPR